MSGLRQTLSKSLIVNTDFAYVGHCYLIVTYRPLLYSGNAFAKYLFNEPITVK